MTATIVVGIDGATRRLIDPWVTDGTLPTFERLFADGVTGELQSVLPPVTSPNWKAYATGKNPGKIGVFWWQNVDVKNRRVWLPAERYQHNTEYWELLATDHRVGVLNVPTTYPPKSVGEFLVSGPPDGENTGFTHPKSLEHTLRSNYEYRVTKHGSLSDGDPDAFEDVLELIDLRFTVAKDLAAEHSLDFLQVTTFYINSLHHHRWNDEYVKRGWKLIDEHLSEFLADEDRNIVLMSDHGHAKIESVFYINEWLGEQGYLSYESDVAETLHSAGITTDRIKRLLTPADKRLSKIDLQSVAASVAPQWLLNRLPDDRGGLGGSKHGMVEWDDTLALASAQGPVYLTVPPSDPQYESLRTELIEALSSLTGADGRPIARDVHRGEAVYSGRFTDEAPDIVIDKFPHVNIRETLGTGQVFTERDRSWAGVNRREGLFCAHGPAFSNKDVGSLSILDLAPTLLHLHGHAVPDDMDGEVRQDVFAEDTAPADREPETQPGDQYIRPST